MGIILTQHKTNVKCVIHGIHSLKATRKFANICYVYGMAVTMLIRISKFSTKVSMEVKQDCHGQLGHNKNKVKAQDCIT
jgi:hypothetical protein